METYNLNFGEALEYLKKGAAVARAGWNGKKMFIYLNNGSIDRKDYLKYSYIDEIDSKLFLPGAEGTVTRLPNINMKSASGATVTGWLASQTDMLAEDWQLLSETWQLL